MRAGKCGAALLAALVIGGCAMARHREQVRQGFFTRGLHREAFLREWGPPTRTFTLPGKEPVMRVHPFYSAWTRPVYEIWEYQDRATCLTFDGVRLVAWQTGRTDCEPKHVPEAPEARRSPRPPPVPPYPESR